MKGFQRINKIDKHIATKMRQFRTQQGISLEELASLIGVSFQQIQKYEAAKNKISASKLFEIVHILNISYDKIFDGLNLSTPFREVKIKSEKTRRKESDKNTKDLLPLVRSFNMIENQQLKKQIVALMKEISGSHYKKKSKHIYS